MQWLYTTTHIKKNLQLSRCASREDEEDARRAPFDASDEGTPPSSASVRGVVSSAPP
jgi:hypothetical protein